MLRKIVLHGFKSFCDRTEVVLGSGITAIVGPNGCGKSNLADAVRWVLGEQNPRVLRCNRLEDVIFSGTERRKAMGMAEVRLLLDGVLDEGEKELLRRFTRDGSSEFRINGKVCRWKDIVEALLGTGLSHTGYVVIGQGAIQELAGGRPEERRVWIEEASGVAKYRLDKRDVEEKLSEARGNIARLDDLLVELSAQKAKLQSDWETARTYHLLSQERSNLELSMWLYQEQEEAKKVTSLRRRLEKYEAELEGARSSIGTVSGEVIPLSEKAAGLKRKLDELTAHRESLAQRLLALEKERDSVRGKLALVAKEIETRTVRESVLRKELEDLNRQEEEISAKRDEAAQRYEKVVELLRQAENERDASESDWKKLSEFIISARAQTVSLTEKLGAVQRAKEEVRKELEEIRQQSVSLKSSLSSLRDQVSRHREEIVLMKERLEKAGKDHDRLTEASRNLEVQVQEKRSALEKVLGVEKSLEARLSLVRGRRRVLEEMEESYEGYGKGPKSVLSAAKRGVLKGVLGPVGELFSCETRFIPALSAAVGGAAENIVVEDEEAAKEAIDFLKKTRSGRCTFLPLTLIRPRNLHPRAASCLDQLKGVRPLISVVNYPPELKNCAAYLFGHVVLADTVDDALQFMKASSWTTRAVTLGGESIEPGGAMTGGEAPRHEIIFQRKHELNTLSSEEANLQKDLASTREKRKAIEGELASLVHKLDRTKKDVLSAESSVARLRESIAQVERAIMSLEVEIRDKAQKMSPLESLEKEHLKQLESLSEEEEKISLEISARERELKEYEDKLKESMVVDRGLSERIQELVHSRETLEREISSFARRKESILGEKASVERSLEEERKEIARLKGLQQELVGQEKNLSEAIVAHDQQMASLIEEISGVEKDLDITSKMLSEKRAQIERLGREVETLRTKIEEGRLELKTAEKALSDTRQFLLSRFGLQAPREIDCQRIPRQEALVKLEEIDEKIRALGTVNLKAEEEYRSLSERIDNLCAEKQDLVEAMKELDDTKELIEKEIEDRFLETFGRVARNFEDIFRDLFGGGRGRLNLVEGTLGVEVVAEPPGRRQKQFNLLSGGERSLCGIALIFSILSVRPSPLIVLDEVDSALDEANVVRFAQFLKRYSKDTQFLVITHQEATMEVADIIYGVTMEEPGVSKVFGMRLESR
ncbi:MAG TPA: chromosome segregation protein SMC [Firmicutes bacterium]|nr:chromosome segregation protein SMC [Candidatus Fermentithermobacillaceae bacterium]